MKKYIFPFILCVLASACTHHLHSQVFAYVPNSGTDNVSVINTTTNAVVATIPVGNGPHGVSVSADGAKVYVTNLNQGNMSVISTATNTVITTIGVGSGAYGVAVSPDGSKVYITRTSQDKVRVIDTGTNSVVATIAVGTNPTGVAVSPDGSKIYVTNQDSNDISVIDASTNAVSATIGVGIAPIGVSVSPDGTEVYVANNGSNDVSVINTSTNVVSTTIGVGTNPAGVSVSTDGTKIYVANNGSNNVSVINTSTNIVSATITVGTNPFGTSVSPDGTKVYVANQGAGTVSVINTSTNMVSTTVTVAGAPFALGNMMPLTYCPPITFTNTTATNATVGNPYTLSASASNASSYSVSPTLPLGINLNTTNGSISGVPTVPIASATYTVTATQGNCSNTQTYTFAVACAGITINPATFPNAVVGSGYSQTLTQTGLAGTPVWSISVGILPLGLNINSASGVISGTPTNAATNNFTVQVTNGTCTQTKAYSIVVACPALVFGITTATNATVGTPYTLSASASNASSYSVSPTLPLGINLNTTNGSISGVPTVPIASATYTVTATQGNCSNTQTYTFAVACAGIIINPATLPNAVVGGNYSQTLTQTGLTGTPAWSITNGLPAWLNINSASGVISGTPTNAATNNFTVQVTNGTCTQTKAYSIVVACPALVFGITTAGGATVGAAYSLNAGVTGNVATVVYSISPSLPLGINLNTSTGAISGTPSAPVASTTYTVTATQGTCTLTQGYTFAVTCPTLVFGVTTAGSATIGTAYSLNAGVTGNTATVAYSVLPALPTGLALETSTGIISGVSSVPVASATYNVTATQGACFATKTYTFAVNPPACPILIFNTANATNATVGTFYRLNPNVTGSTGGLIHTLSNSNLPIGLDFNPSTGEVSGTPTTIIASASCTITATQGACSVSQNYAFAVVAAPIPLAVPTTDIRFVPSPNVNTPNNVSFTWTSIAGATGYKVRRATTENANGSLVWVQLPIINGNTNTIYVDKDIKYDLAMYYSVQALSANAGLPSAWSSAISVIVTSYNNPISSLNNEESNKVIISPNPATDSFVIDNIDKNILGGEMMFVLTDATGKTVLTETSQNGFPYKMNIANVASGLYYLKISNTHASKGMTKGNTMVVKKIVKLN